MDARKNKRSLVFGVSGLLLQLIGFVCVPLIQEIDPQLGPLIGLPIIWLGVGLLVVGLGYYASAKGHHWAWGLMGLLSIIGLIVLSALPDRYQVRDKLRSLPLDSTEPVAEGGPVFHCFGCGYILNGINSSACPECGRQYNAGDPASMRVTDAQGHDWLQREKPPWTARWSLICGILSLVMFCVPLLNMIPAACGVGFGHAARRAVRDKPSLRGSAGVALAGLIVSYIALAIALAGSGLLIASLAIG